MSIHSRVSKGVPEGGEFATEAKGENPDLATPTSTPEFAADIASWTGGEIVDNGLAGSSIEVTTDMGSGAWMVQATNGDGFLPTDKYAVVTVSNSQGQEMDFLTLALNQPSADQVADTINIQVDYLAQMGRGDRNERIQQAVDAAVADGQFMSWHQGTYSTPTLSMGRNAAGQQVRVTAILTKDRSSGLTDRQGVISAETGSWNLSLRGTVVGNEDSFESLHRVAGEVGPDNPELAELAAISARYHGVSNNCPGTVKQMVQSEQIEAEEGGRTDTWRARCEAEIAEDHGHKFGGFLVKELDVRDVRRITELMVRPAMKATPYT